MNNLAKDIYIRESLRKIGRQQKWEVYVITRIIHLLNDDNLEFSCQQYVKDKDKDNYYYTDLCFPSLGLYIEVNEEQHGDNQIEDKERQEAIQNSTSWKELNIDVYRYEYQDNIKTMVSKSLEDVNKIIENIVEEIKKRKSELESRGKKIIWDYNAKYDPKRYIEKGSINPENNISFRYQREAAMLFGYIKKGNISQGSWHIKGTNETVWFPKLYKNLNKRGAEEWEWINKIDSKLEEITMQLKINGVSVETPELLQRAIVFAHQKNRLGEVVYRFMGVFEPSKECHPTSDFKKGKTKNTNSKINVYQRIKEKDLDLTKYHINSNQEIWNVKIK